jgi:hypothetical protein
MTDTNLEKVRKLGRDVNIVRYVGGAHYDGNTGKVQASAFDRIRKKDEDGLSFTQRDMLAIVSKDDETAIRKVVGSRLTLGKTAVFAELNAGQALDALDEFESEFFFQLDPLVAEAGMLANPAHALLIGLPFKGEAVGSLRSELAGDLLRRRILRTFPAIDAD